MINVPMNADGPDADECARLVANDPSIKGMWIVPTYANPTGAICSQEVAAKLAAMPAAAPDFRIFWDNAYAVHHLGAAARADELAATLSARLPEARPCLVSEVGAVIGAHAGPGLLGVVVVPYAEPASLSGALPGG